MGVNVVKRGAVLDLEPNPCQLQLQAMAALRPHARIGLLCRGLQRGGNELQQNAEFRQVDAPEQVISAGIKAACRCLCIGGSQGLEDFCQYRVDLRCPAKAVHSQGHRPVLL